MSKADLLLNGARELCDDIAGLAEVNKASELSKQKMERTIARTKEQMESDGKALDVTNRALEIIREVSDETVQKTYSYMVESINAVLARLFTETERRIKIVESMRGAYPQLELELYTEGGIKRSLKDDSGHGIMQVISLLSNLCLIVINNSRRIYVLDETLSGLSAKSREIVDMILWTFADIGFQFIVCEHGYIPKGAHVYQFEVKGRTASITKDYIADKGVYLTLPSEDTQSDIDPIPFTAHPQQSTEEIISL